MAIWYPQSQFFDNNGNPLASGKLYTYAAGTSTPQVTYKDNLAAVEHTNPIILTSSGRPPGGSIWLDSSLSYKFVLKTSADVTLNTDDNITTGGSTFAAGITLGGNLDVNGNLITSSSDGDVTISPNGTGTTNIHDLEAQTDIDMNGYNIKFDTATGLKDDSGNEQLMLTKTASAVNYLNVTNTATGTGPLIAATGDDAAVDLRLDAKGSGRIKALDGLDVTGSITATSTIAGTGITGTTITGTSTGSVDTSMTVTGTGAVGGALILNDADDSHNLTVIAPNTISSSFTMTLPSSNASGTLNNNGSGTLSFGAPTLTGMSGNISTTGTITGAGTLTVNGNASQAGRILLYEDTDNGSNYIDIRPGVDNVTSTHIMYLPAAGQTKDYQGLVASSGGLLLYRGVASEHGSVAEAAVATGQLSLSTSTQQGFNYIIDILAKPGTDNTDLTLQFTDAASNVHTIVGWVLDYFDGSTWTRNTTGGKISVGQGNGADEYLHLTLTLPIEVDGANNTFIYGCRGTGSFVNAAGTVNTFNVACKSIGVGSSGHFQYLKLTSSSGNVTWEATAQLIRRSS